MKKIVSILLAFVMLAGILAGCGEIPEATAPVTQPPQPTQPEETIPVGNQVGNKCFSFDLEVVDENGATGETVDPSATGKVTVLNFWGTWCNPCVSELPGFDEVAATYDVAVIAVHSKEDKKEMPAYIGKHYPESQILFAWDQSGEDRFNDEFYVMMGNVGFYPYTLILNAEGIITKTFNGMIDHDTLVAAIVEAGATEK